MNISDFSAVVQCERSHYARTKRPWSGSVSASSYVRNVARNLLFERDSTAAAGKSGRVESDSLTPCAFDGDRQGKIIANAVKLALAEKKWAITGGVMNLEHEGFSGRFDFWMALYPENGEALALLKTDASVGAGWLQLGALLWCDKPNYELLKLPFPASHGVIIHAPRTSPNRDQVVTIEARSQVNLIREFIQWRTRHKDVLESRQAPLASPGHHCRYCNVNDCHVRSFNHE